MVCREVHFLERIGDNIEAMNQNLQKAMDRMDQADIDGEKLIAGTLPQLYQQITL